MGRETTFQDYLYVIFTKKWIILSIFLATFGATLWYTYTTPKVYEAIATIMIKPDGASGFPFTGSRPFYPNINIRSYCEILTSKAVAEQAAEILKDKGFRFSFLNHKAPAETLLTRISVKPVINSDIIKVSAKASSPDEAVAITNAIVEGFMEEQLLDIRKGIAEQRAFLEAQIPAIKSNLEESEQEIKEFKERNRIVFLSNEAKELAKELADFDRLYGESEASCKALNGRLSSLKDELAKRKAVLVEEITEVSSPYILQLRKELTSLETNYSLYLVQGLTEDNLKLIDLKKSIEGTKAKLVEETKKIVGKELPSLDPLSASQELVDNILELEVELAAREAEKGALFKLRKQYENRLYSLPKSEFELAQLERERMVNATAYELLMKSYKEAQISEAGTVSNVRVVDMAETSRVPVKPKKRLNLLLGAILGIVLSFGGALLADYVGGSIKTSKDVEIYTNFPVLGSIPKVRTRFNRPYLLQHPGSTYISEAYRTLRTNIGFANPDYPVKTILVTSAVPREGKSIVACDLSIVMAQLGKRVLLADADLRKPALAKFFEIKSDTGITNVLIKETVLSSAIVDSGIENLSLLSSGKIPPNPSELLNSQQMDILIKKVKEEFDYIVFDSPPTVSVTDAAVLSTKLDGVLIVVEANKTNKFALTHAKESFERVNARILGVVLNKVPSGYMPYGYPHYHSYYRYYSTERGVGKREDT